MPALSGCMPALSGTATAGARIEVVDAGGGAPPSGGSSYRATGRGQQTLRTKQGEALAGPAGEEPGVVADGEMLAGKLAEDGAEVGGHRQVAPFVERGAVEAFREGAVHLAAVDPVAEDEQAGAVAVVGASRAVLAHGAAELGHGGEQHVVLVRRPEVGPERFDR